MTDKARIKYLERLIIEQEEQNIELREALKGKRCRRRSRRKKEETC